MRHPVGGKMGGGGREQDRETDIQRQRDRDTENGQGTSRQVSKDTILEVNRPAPQPSVCQVRPAGPFPNS